MTCRCFSWAGVTIYYPTKACWDCCWRLWVRKVNCAKKYFSVTWMDLLMQLTGEIVLMLSWVTKGGFVHHQNWWHWWCFLLHWDSGQQGSVFFPPWHHKQHGCPYWCVVTALGGRLFRPMVTVNIPLQRKRGETKESPKITVLAKYFIDTDLPVILQVLNQAWQSFLYSGQKESLFLTVNLHVLDSGYY